MKENKLELSEELGDMVKPQDPSLAIAIYKKANIHGKVVQSLMETGQTNEAMSYST